MDLYIRLKIARKNVAIYIANSKLFDINISINITGIMHNACMHHCYSFLQSTNMI